MANTLAGLHVMLAIGLENDEFMLRPDEAQALAQASAKVASYYMAIELGGKKGAWVALMTTAGMIYVPRVWRHAAQKRALAAGVMPAHNPAQETTLQ